MALAEVCGVRNFEPGEIVLRPEVLLKRLLIRIEGSLEDRQGKSAGDLLGIQSLLFDRAPDREILAGKSGARCLLLDKGHFFRTMYELPEIAQGIVALQPKQEVRT